MARTLIPTLIANHDSATSVALSGGVNLSAVASHGGYNGSGYYFPNPTGKTCLVLILDTPSRSKGKLTLAVQPIAADTMTIGATVYTFRALVDFNVPGEVLLGADVAATRVNLVAALQGTDGVNSADPAVTVVAFNGTTLVITAIVPGAAGDSIATTETFTSGSNVFDAATLGTESAGGQDSAAEVKIFAVADPFGRGGPGATPTYDLDFNVVAGGVGSRVLPLTTVTPVLYNQADGTVNVDVLSLTGTGRLACLVL